MTSQEQLPIFFANPDVAYANQFHISRFTNGAFRLCIERLYKVCSENGLSCLFLEIQCPLFLIKTNKSKEMIGQDLVCTLYGKPFQISYEYAKQKLNELASETLGSQQIDTIYAIGDNPLSGKHGLYTRVLHCLTRGFWYKMRLQISREQTRWDGFRFLFGLVVSRATKKTTLSTQPSMSVHQSKVKRPQLWTITELGVLCLKSTSSSKAPRLFLWLTILLLNRGSGVHFEQRIKHAHHEQKERTALWSLTRSCRKVAAFFNFTAVSRTFLESKFQEHIQFCEWFVE